MAKKTRAQLKALWLTGYTPTQADYEDLFDTIYALLDDELPLGVALMQLDTDIEVATSIANFPIPENMTFVSAFINVSVAPVGSNAIWDLNLNGSTILSTKITVEAGETSSLTAANQPVFSTSTASKGDQLTVDCDQIGAITPGQNPVLVILYLKE